MVEHCLETLAQLVKSLVDTRIYPKESFCSDVDPDHIIVVTSIFFFAQ